MDTLEIVPVGHWSRGEDRHADLTALQPDEHVAEWVRLTDAKAQVTPIESKRTDGRGHRKEGGINAAVRELGRTA